MRRAIGIGLDYLKNALKSALIGALVAVALALIRGEAAVRLADAGTYALIGAICGTCSKGVMVGPVFREKRYLAYLLNALVVAVVIIASVQVFLEGFEGMETWAIVLVFALPEAASIFLVRMELDEARKFERAFKKRREALDIEEGK